VIRLFTSWYREPREPRRAEYLACLQMNLDCAEIDAIHILIESGEDSLPEEKKIKRRSTFGRPHYSDFTRWIDEIVSPGDISIIANSDIAFDRSIAFAGMKLRADECYALARWDGGRLFDRNDSQDAWIFRGKMRPMHNDFSVGVPRCDNRLLHELRSAGYRVRNPAFAIRTNHIHAGVRPEYAMTAASSWVSPPYGYLWPHNLLSLPMTMLHNVAHPRSPIPWRVDPRGKLATLPGRVARRLRRAMNTRRAAA
jgi:hypothetical protein